MNLAERLLGNWAPTLRSSLLLAAGFLGLAVVLVVTFGFGGVLLSCGFGLALHRLTHDEGPPCR